MAAPRMLIGFTLATAGVVLIVVALATESWWLIIPALAAHAGAFVLTTGMVLKETKQQEKPDPVTEARVEEERKKDPDGDDDAPKMAI